MPTSLIRAAKFDAMSLSHPPLRKRADDPRPIFLAFVLKHQRVVCGFLTAEYFTHTGTIFLWYLHVDKTKLPAHEIRQRGSLKLLAAKVKAADRSRVRWRHALSEVEANAKDLPSAQAKLHLFQNAAEELSRRAGRETVKVFRMPIEYRQPILDLRWIDAPRDHEVPEWLLYAPRRISDGLRQTPTGVLMEKTLAAQLLDTLLMKSYARAFAHSQAYGSYCQSMLDHHLLTLPDELELQEDTDLIELRRQKATEVRRR